jgi:hypothetical protein
MDSNAVSRSWDALSPDNTEQRERDMLREGNSEGTFYDIAMHHDQKPRQEDQAANQMCLFIYFCQRPHIDKPDAPKT